MKLFTAAIKTKLLANGILSQEDENQDQKPVVKLFGGAACTWLLSELDEDVRAFGLCDLGVGCPELGYVLVSDLEAVRFPPFGLPVERDISWTPEHTLSEYAATARGHSRIVA